MARHAGDARQSQSIDTISTDFDSSQGITAETVRDIHSARANSPEKGAPHRLVKPQRDAARCGGVSLFSSSRLATSTPRFRRSSQAWYPSRPEMPA
jgi:hypothetical protein